MKAEGLDMRSLIAALLIVLAAAPLTSHSQGADDKASKAVLVTGASTGIGRKITERLAADGYFVYAGARKEADLKSLGGIRNVQPVRLDVNNPADITAALETITKAGRGLYGLVNNAGIATLGTATETTPEEFDLVMQVNLYGPYRVTKAFAPLIIAQKGRITTIGSISGILASRDLTAYTMSKHAVEAFADSLALQMAPLGVGVSVIEPGNFNSEIGKSALQRTGGGDTRLADRSRFKEPDEVAAAALRALFEPSPRRRYMVVPNQSEAEATIRKQIEQLVQLNEGQPYTYDREALVKMLDEALAKSLPRSAW
jgi:NAD(P)-dependent dehydrogenase (short-subunit alcohol dehydrogenase family)